MKKINFPRLEMDRPLAALSTFNIGGPADFFYKAQSEKDLITLVRLAKEEKIPFVVIGGGSNLLFDDRGFRGLVIKMADQSLKIKQGGKITVAAGMFLGKLVNLCTQKGLAGLEFAAGVPGTLGGAIVGNAGAWQESIGEKVLRVKVLDEKGEIRWLEQKDCHFEYRDSLFKKEQLIVLGAELFLKQEDPQIIKKRVEENLNKRLSQPKGPSAGSVFINPLPDSASVMIEKCGFKGYQIGGAKISDQHANFIINTGGAKASDVLELIALVEKKVKQQFGVDLKMEIKFLKEKQEPVLKK
jgi:UDP-N-acetylmuramate dehydrogenase